MELNKKCFNILQYLKQENDYVTIKTLAKMYNLSERAIRYNIVKIENFLVKNGFSYEVFNVDIIDTISSRAISSVKNKKVDFIISTIEIPELDKSKYI